MLIKECPLCGCKEILDVPDLGCKCANCDEVFKYDERDGFTLVPLEEWVEYLNKAAVNNNQAMMEE